MRPPPQTEEILHTLDRVMMVDYEIPDFISGQAADLIKRLLTKDPIQRIKLSSVLHHPFMVSSLSVTAITSPI